MTNDEVRRAERRIADARIARRAELDEAARPPGRSEDLRRASFGVGDRVLDLRSGREGTVELVGVSDRSGGVLVSVRFDDRTVGSRAPADLVARPRPPAARS